MGGVLLAPVTGWSQATHGGNLFWMVGGVAVRDASLMLLQWTSLFFFLLAIMSVEVWGGGGGGKEKQA